MKNTVFLLLSILVAVARVTSAQAQPRVGREEAGTYFEPQNQEVIIQGAGDHFLALHAGRFMEASAWEWGDTARQESTGSYTLGMTYKVSPYNSNMDMNLRVEGNEYEVAGEKPFKLSFMPMIIFPEATSKFPLYFGAGVGAGVFFRQIKDESYLSFDYQLIMGVRFFDVYENTGFFVETGLKNHLLLLTSGQFNSVFLSGGAVFTF